MKKTLLIFCVLLSSCDSNNNEVLEIDSLKKYAIDYPVAAKSSEIQFELQEVPDTVENIINKRVIDDEFKLYVSLILARHYRSHIMYANQSYIIKKNHPLWRVFEKYSNTDFQSEYELSNVIYYNWLSKKKQLEPILKVEYEAIKKELIRIGNPH